MTPSIPDVPWGRWTDPRTTLAELDRLSARFAAQAGSVNEALGEAHGEHDDGRVVVRVAVGRLEHVAVLPAMAGTSPVQARQRVLEAWRTALVAGNRSGAAALEAVADLPGGAEAVAGYRDALPLDARDVAAAYDREHPGDADPADRRGSDAAPPGFSALDPERSAGFSREALAELLGPAGDDDEIVDSLAELAAELDVDAHRVPGDPATWQAALEAEVAQLSASAADLTSLMSTVTATEETALVRLTVNAAGGLVDVTFRGRALSRLDELNADLIDAVPAAHRAASRALERELADRGWAPAADDPTMALLRPADDAGPDEPGRR